VVALLVDTAAMPRPKLDGRAGTELELELDATMPVPGLVPLVGVGDAFANGFMEAAVRGLSAGS